MMAKPTFAGPLQTPRGLTGCLAVWPAVWMTDFLLLKHTCMSVEKQPQRKAKAVKLFTLGL